MKKVLGLLLLLSLTVSSKAQDDGRSYLVVERGPHHRILQRVTAYTNPLGSVFYRTNSYTELQTGMHVRQADGSWKDASEEIVITIEGAAATNTQHPVFFAANLAATPAVDLQIGNGEHLRSRILGLSYFDGATGRAALIAETKDSIGQLFHPNQVIYTNAFDDVLADVQYLHTKAGLEQNIVLRARLPSPAEFDLNPATTRLQVLTEFFEPLVPQKYAVNRPGEVTDETLDFGLMKIGPGRAFAIGDEARIGKSLRVTKQWKVMEGRTFLVEEVPFTSVDAQISALLERGHGASLRPGRHGENLFAVLKTLPSGQKTNAMAVAMQVVKLMEQRQPGFVLDYMIVSTATNFTFQGDTTYLLSGAVNLSGTTTLEGGAVIKHGGANGWRILDLLGPLVCQTAPYRPAIFTSRDDDSVGEIIDGSSGVPSIDVYFYIAADGPGSGTAWDFKYARMAFGYAGFVGYDGLDVLVRHCQFVSNSFGAGGVIGDVAVENVLFSACDIPIYANENVSTEHVTVDGYSTFVIADTGFSSLMLTNCLIVGTGALTGRFYGNGSLPTPVLDHTIQLASASGVFQTVGAGAHYLANNSTNRDAGTTNISATLLAALTNKTTYPPLLLTNTILSSTNLVPQAPRDTNNLPDLGFHYDPVDFLTHWFTVSNATLTVSEGTAIASYNDTGIWIADGSSIFSVGTPLAPNWFTRYSSVQEQPLALGSGLGMDVNSFHYGSAGPTGVFQFCKFTCPAGDGYHLYHYDYDTNSDLYAFGSLSIRDCEFWNGLNYLGGSISRPGSATVNNNLFYRSRPWAQNTSGQQSLGFSNNLVVGASAAFHGPASDLWRVYDNSFDNCILFLPAHLITNGYNAYINCGTNQLSPTNVHDVVLANFAYEAGPLGDFYQPTNSALLNTGSLTSAALAGLYHYTTATNQVKETNSVLDIGYHYVATTNGSPIDSDGDGVADYFEDTNGNGIFDSGDFGDFTSFLYATTNFAGMNNHTHPLLPDWRPDTMGAVGPDHFVEMVNSAVSVYAKSNGLQLATTSLDNFFRLTNGGNIYPDPNRSGQDAHAGDPRVVYDHGSKRWFACALDIGRGDVLLAVSKTNDPVGDGGATWVSTNWSHYLVPTGTNNQESADQPRLGVDSNGVYIVVYSYYHIFQGPTINTSRVAALPKGQFLDMSAPTVQSNYILDYGASSDSVWNVPAVNFDPVTTNDPAWFFFASGTNVYYNQLKWTNGFASPPGFQMTNWGQLAIPESLADFGTYNGRFTMATLRTVNGTQCAWTCHTVGVNSNGNYDVPPADRTAIEWFKIELTPTAKIADTGRVFDSAVTNYPMIYDDSSLAVNKNGEMVIGFSGSSDVNRMAAYYWGKLHNGASSRTPTRYYVTTNVVSPLNAIPTGDYSCTSLDPVDDLTIWTIQEYAEITNSTPPALTWGTAFVPIKPY